MANKLQELQETIEEIEELINNPKTDDATKNVMKSALQTAKKELADLKAESVKKPSSELKEVKKPSKEPKSSASEKGTSSLAKCQELLAKYKHDRTVSKQRIDKRKKAGKPVELTPSETITKTAKVVGKKVESIKEDDKQLTEQQKTAMINGIVATVKNTLKGIDSAKDKNYFISDLVKDINALKSDSYEYGGYMADGGMMAKGGKVKVGDIITTNTGVKVKVIEYDTMFGGRVKVERQDEFATGKPSQFISLSKFKFEDGGMMAKGGEFPISNSKMIGKIVTIKLPTELEPFKDKVVEEYSDSIMGKKGFWSKKYIVKKSEDGGMMEHGGMISLSEYYNTLPNKQDLVGLRVYDAVNDRFLYIKEAEEGIFAGKNNNDDIGHYYPLSQLKVKSMGDGGMMEHGGATHTDLFQDYENMPPEVAEVFNQFGGHDVQEMDYSELKEMLDAFENVGYTFDYGLDGEPYGLRPMGVDINELEGYEDEYAKGGSTKDEPKVVRGFFEDEGYEYDNGGMMAKGGKIGQFEKGQSVIIVSDNDNYDDYRGKELVITYKSTSGKYFDSSMEGQGLYDFKVKETGEQVPFSLYDYEIEEYEDGGMMAKGGYMEDGGETKGKNGYVAFYKGKRIEVYADTMYAAQLKAAKIFNAKKSYDVNVVLAELDGKQYVNSTMMANGGMMAKGGAVRGGKFEVGDKVMIDDSGYVRFFSEFDLSEPATILEKRRVKTSRGIVYTYSVQLADGKKPFNSAMESQLTLVNSKMAKGGMMSYGGLLEQVSEDWGKDSDFYSELEEAIVGWSDRNGELSPKGKIAIKHLLNNWDSLEDYEQFLEGDTMAKGGEVDRERMYNFLKDDLAALEKAIEENNQEEIDKFFSYWNSHLSSLEPKTSSKRMYEFLKDDLVGLEAATKELPSSKEETDRFFSYWNQHLNSLQPNMAYGGMMAKGGMTSTKAEQIFAEYEENEDNNLHSENVVLLAKHFGTEQDLKDAKIILSKHNSIGYMPTHLMSERDAISSKLYPKLVEAKKKMADGGMMAKGGSTEDVWVVTFQNQYSGELEEVTVSSLKEGNNKMSPSYIAMNKQQVIDVAKQDSGLSSDWQYYSAEKQMADGGMMEDGGRIKLKPINYNSYDNRSLEYLLGEIAHTERSARQFSNSGDMESAKDRQEHAKKLWNIYYEKKG